MSDQNRGKWTSARNALADQLCRGRYQAQKNLPELPSTEVTEAGAVIHALWTGTDPHRKPTAEESEKAQELREQENRLAREFFGTDNGVIRIVERRLWHEFLAGPEEAPGSTFKTSGQFDIALVRPESRRALICDAKSGWLPVSANPSNLQLRRLATLLWLHIEAQEIGVCILKPFAQAQPPCVYTAADLAHSLAEMQEDVRQSHRPNAPRTAGEEQCRYCRAREQCPTRLAWLAEALPASVPSLPMVSARDWSPDQRVLFLQREKEARDWLETRKAEIKELLAQSSEAAPGFGLKPGHIVETITDSQQVWQRFAQLGGTLESFIRCIKLGKTALKQELRALTGHGGKGLEVELENLLSGCVECTSSASTIERLKDTSESTLPAKPEDPKPFPTGTPSCLNLQR